MDFFSVLFLLSGESFEISEAGPLISIGDKRNPVSGTTPLQTLKHETASPLGLYQTKPNQTKSNQIKPNQTKSNQTKPNQTKPYLTNSMIWDINTGQYAGVSREANIKATLDDRVRKQR